MAKRRKINYKKKVNSILINLEKLHKKYYSTRTFYGPSLYFHKRALIKSDNKYEYIYAALTSWGMHRMGKGGAKMTDFETFIKSINTVKQHIEKLKNKKLENLKEKDFEVLEEIFKNIQIMETKTKIVGHSKVIAHLLPNVVPPIDREYTFYFLKGSKSIVNDLDKEWILYKTFIQEFFQKISIDKRFKKFAIKSLKNKKEFPWDTSIPKIIDNLVIAATPRKK